VKQFLAKLQEVTVISFKRLDLEFGHTNLGLGWPGRKGKAPNSESFESIKGVKYLWEP
jgi:hypothetical protein